MYQYPTRRLASIWSWIASLAMLCLMVDSASATVLFVRVNGSDDADGLSPSTAFATIQRAAAAIRNPGDQVIVGPGTFSDGDIFPARSGYEGHEVEFVADTAGAVTGDAAGPVVVRPQAPHTTGFLLAGRHDIRIDGFTILGAVDAGIQVRADVTAVNSSNVTIRNTEIRNCVKRGIDITASGTIVVANNRAMGNGSAGVSIDGVAGVGATVAVLNNQASSNGSHGLFVVNAGGGAITDNDFEQNAEYGILVRASANVDVEGNTVVANHDGIGAGFGANATDAVSAVRVTDNDVRSSVSAGINVVASDSAAVEENTVANSGATGVTIVGNGTTKISVRNNQVGPSGIDGVFARGAAPLTIGDNILQASRRSGVHIQQSSNVAITDNTIASNIAAGVDAVSTGSVALRRNSIIQNGTIGASLVADASATILIDVAGNTVQRNSGGGVFVVGAAGGSVADNIVEDNSADGVVVRLSTRLSFVRNHVAGSNGNGIAVGVGTEQTGGSDFLLLSNDVDGSTKGGIAVYASGTVTTNGNSVLHSGTTGLSLQSAGNAVIPTISNNTIGTSGSHGIFLQGSNGGVVQNNLVFSNGDTGITLRTAPDALVVNNLVYDNVNDGLALGTNDLAAPRAKILQNTVYGNGGWGLRIGTAQAPSPGALVAGNIFRLNQGDKMQQGAGIAVARSSTCGYVAGFNINPDGYGQGTPFNNYDLIADPLFLSPAGADGRLGGDDYADDDFRLQQRRGGQTVQSPGIDAGPALVADIGLMGTTAHNGVPDVGVIDIGYHYGAAADQHTTTPVLYMPVFVRPNGSKANDGLAPERALASIQDAAERAGAGGTVVVGPGTYAEMSVHPLQNRGPVTFFADTTGTATGDVPGVVLLDATGGDTGFTLLNACNATVRGFSVTGAMSAGIQVRDGSDDSVVRDNVVFSNQRRGIESLGAEGAVIDNNLVYANGTGGIRIEQGNNGTIANNTVYANGADAILVGGSGTTGPALGTAVLRNIVAGNGKGVLAQQNSFTGYLSGFNVVPDGFQANTPRADSDFVPAKSVQLFVNPLGPDGKLGGTDFLDDDFHLAQSAANPALGIDDGESNTLLTGSTRSNGVPNVGSADAGYHYPFLYGLSLPAAAPGVIFVRTSGNDSNYGFSPDRAFASIQRALTAVSGDGVIVIGPGVYHEQRLLFGVPRRSNAVVVLLGDESGQLTGDPAGKVVVDAGGHAAPMVVGPARLDGLTLSGARGPGLRVSRAAHDVTLRNSTLCGNSGDGIVTFGDAVSIVNNLICGNGGNGVSVRLRGAHAATQLLNNTVAANMQRGIVIHETGAPVARGVVYNNIISGNGSTGITARAARRAALAAGNNLNTDGYGARMQAGDSDVDAAPQFAGGAASKGIGCESADGMRVQPTSPGIDRGTRTAVELGLGNRSVVITQERDTGPTDLGYHYPQ